MMSRTLDEKVELKIANAIASVEMEGMILSVEEIELLRKYAYGDLTEAEFLEIVTKIPNEFINSRSE